MIITEDKGEGIYRINSYTLGKITINEILYTHSLILTPNQLIPFWEPQSFEELNDSHLQPILALKPDVVLLGTGQKIKMLPPKLLAKFASQHLRIESMDTGAACRTYTALMAEGRNVAAALIVDATL